MFGTGTIRREATDPSAHRNAWSGAQQQQQQHQQQQHQQPLSQQSQQQDTQQQQPQQQQQHLQHPLPHHGQQHHLHQPQHQHHTLHNQQPDQPAQRGRGGTSNMTVVSSGGGGSAAATARAARSSPMVQMAIAALVSFNSDHHPSPEMLSFHEDILDAAARAWDAGYHWSISIFAIALRAIIRDVAAERRHKFGSTLDPAYVEKVTCVIQTRFLAVDPALGVPSSASTSTPPASSAVPSATTLAAATHVSPQQAPHLAYHDVQATAAAALAVNPLTAPSINVKASSSPSPALSSSVLVPPAVRVIQPPPPSPHHGHTPPPGPGQPHPNKLPAIQPQPPLQPRPPHPQQLPSQQAILPLPRPHRQPLPQGPSSQPVDQDQDQTDPPGSPPAKRRRPLPTVGVHSWAVANGNSNSNAGTSKSTSASPPRAKATSGNLAPPEEETISAKRRRRRSDRGGDPGAYRNVGGYGDVTASGYGYGYTGTVKCTMPPCEWTAVTTSMRMGLRLNDHLLRKHGVENSAIRLRPSYIRRMPRSHAAVRVVKERGPYRSAREALIRIADSLSASIKDWRCPPAIGKLREERAREVFPHTDDVKSMSGKDLREELVRMRTGDGMQIAAAAMAAENTRLGVANHKDSPLEVWTRDQFLPWQASVKEVDPAALAASESAQLGTKSPETMNRWLENHFRPWESKDGGGEGDDGSTVIAAGTAPREEDDEDDSKGEGEEDGPSDEDRSDDDDENDA